MSWQDKLLEASNDPDAAKQVVEELIEQAGHDNELLGELGPWLEAALKAASPLSVKLARRLVRLAHQVMHPGWLVAAVLLPLLHEDIDWLVGLDEGTRDLVVKRLQFLQRQYSDWEAIGIVTARAQLEGVDAPTMHRQMIVETIDATLRRPRGNLSAALTRLANSSFSMEWPSSRLKQLSSKLETALVTNKHDEAQHIAEAFAHARHRMTYTPVDLELMLRPMVMIATRQGPAFFEQHIIPLLEEVHVTDPQLVEALANYRIQHEGLVIEAEPSPEKAHSRYYAMDRVSYYDAPCRFIDMGWRPDRPAWWKHDWQGGARLEPAPEAPLSFVLKPLDRRIDGAGEELPLLKLGRVPVMHKRLVVVLEELGVAMQVIPAVLVEPDKSQRFDGYFAVNILGTICPKRLGRFHGRLTDPSPALGTGFEFVTGIDEPIDGLLCAWIEDTNTLVAFESLRDALESAGFDELQFHELEHTAL